MAVFFCDAMEKDGIQKSPFSLLDLCKMALFKEYYSGLNSLKRTHKTFSAKFASLPPELREALIEHFNHMQSYNLQHATWRKIEHITLKPEDYDRFQASRLAVDFPPDTHYYSFSLDETWAAFSSLDRTDLKKWDTQQQQYKVVRSFDHTGFLPQKISFSSDNNFLVFEFSPEIVLLKKENEDFPESTIERLNKNECSIKYLVGFSNNNQLVTHHADYARLDFWDTDQNELPWTHSMYFPTANIAEQDASAHLFTSPSRTSFYYINDDNELYTNDYILDFHQITVKLALEKYIHENNLTRLYKLKKSKKLNAFSDPNNRRLMQKYIEDALARVKNALITRALQRMWEYHESDDLDALRSLLTTIFPADYKNQRDWIRVQEQVLGAAQEFILHQKIKTNKDKQDLINIPLLVLFEKHPREPLKIGMIKKNVYETIETIIFQLFNNLRKKRNNSRLTHFFHE